MKRRVKEYSIKKGVDIAKEKQNERITLEQELQTIDQMQNIPEEKIFRKFQIQNRLDEIYNEYSAGARIRARLETVNENETNTNYFKNIEKSRQTNNVIDTLLDINGNETSDQGEILNIMAEFYTKLYTSENIDQFKIDTYLDKVGEL